MCVSVFLFLGSFLNFSLGKNLAFVDLKPFALLEGEKMKCEVILPSNEMIGENTLALYFH